MAHDLQASEARRGAIDRRESRLDWLRASVLAGFCATFAMTAALAAGYLLANAIGSAEGSRFERWTWALTENELTENVGDAFGTGLVLNLIVGVAWGVVYGRFVEPRLSGPGWRQGVIFSLVLWLLSLIVFFPFMGVGPFGTDIDAGPLPAIGNLIAHLVYGVVLGTIYAMEEAEDGAETASQRATSASAERGAAIGVLAGGVVGLIGGWVIAPTMSDLAGQPVIALAGALAGAAMGILIGSLISMHDDPAPTTSTLPADADHSM